MFEPVRGGTRGGQAEFKWSDVSADKDRENYLGHSINAPTGRWQKNKDIHWYNRDLKLTDEERVEEIRKIKQLEADALSAALGFEPSPVVSHSSEGVHVTSEQQSSDPLETQKALEKQEKRRRKAERKEEKRLRKESKHLNRSHIRRPDTNQDTFLRNRHRSRSRSPRRRSNSPKHHSEDNSYPQRTYASLSTSRDGGDFRQHITRSYHRSDR